MALDTSRGSSDRLSFLSPVFLHRVWGGTRLADYFGYELPGDHIGEAVAISAMPGADCLVSGGAFRGRTLSDVWANEPAFFARPSQGSESEPGLFPLQIKLLDAHADLSIQVHPGDAYARAHGAVGGKNECWYVLRPSDSGRIVMGHTAPTVGAFAERARAGRWQDLLRYAELAGGEAFLIPAGTVHAILAGTMIYEVQQPSDVTYRLYDYDRLDGGVPRTLHFEEALEVVVAPSAPHALTPTVERRDNAMGRLFAAARFFQMAHWDVRGHATLPVPRTFAAASVLAGRGTLDGVPVEAGDHFVIGAGPATVRVTGAFSVMLASV